jgi:hypothetical protein
MHTTMTQPTEQVELSCRLRVPATSQYAPLLRYLRDHPYKSIHTSLLDAAIAFYLPQSLIEGSASAEVLQNAGRQSIAALLAQMTLIAVQVNADLPDGQQIHIPFNDWEASQSTLAQSEPMPIEREEPVSDSDPPLINPFNFANFNSSGSAL